MYNFPISTIDDVTNTCLPGLACGSDAAGHGLQIFFEGRGGGGEEEG